MVQTDSFPIEYQALLADCQAAELKEQIASLQEGLAEEQQKRLDLQQFLEKKHSSRTILTVVLLVVILGSTFSLNGLVLYYLTQFVHQQPNQQLARSEIYPISDALLDAEIAYRINGETITCGTSVTMVDFYDEGEKIQGAKIYGNIKQWHQQGCFDWNENSSTIKIIFVYLHFDQNFLKLDLNIMNYWNPDYSLVVSVIGEWRHVSEDRAFEIFSSSVVPSEFVRLTSLIGETAGFVRDQDFLEFQIYLELIKRTTSITTPIQENQPTEDVAREVFSAFDFQLKYSFVYNDELVEPKFSYEEIFGLGWFLLVYEDEHHGCYFNQTWHLTMTQIKPLDEWRPLFIFHSIGEHDSWITYFDQDDWFYHTLKLGESWNCSFPHYNLIIEALIFHESDI